MLLAAVLTLPALASAAWPALAPAQQMAAQQTVAQADAAAAIPDAPGPQLDAVPAQPEQVASNDPAQTPAPAAQQKGAQPDRAQQNSAQDGSSRSQSGQPAATQQPSAQSQRQTAKDQLKAEEKQRVLGIVPTFNTTYISNAASLSAGQKMQLAFRSATDPFTFGAAFIVAGLHEALDQDPGFGWGAEGYFKRSGAAYLDAFDGDMIGNGILPAIFHQDPRYFRLGHGTFRHRVLYALATNVICKHDNTGRWEPNYSNVGGNIIAGGISNLYYPSQNSGWSQTISNGLIVTAEGGVGSLFQEFWPDVSRKVLHKDPTDGMDAQAAAQDKAQQQK